VTANEHEQLPPEVRQVFTRLEEREAEQGPLFPEVLFEYMAERGIATLEELHRRYVEAGGELELETLQYHLTSEDEFIYTDLITPLRRALGIGADEDAAYALAVAYAMGYAPPLYC